MSGIAPRVLGEPPRNRLDWRGHRADRQRAHVGRGVRPVPTMDTVILGVAASDAHVVANQIIAFQLRGLGYHVVNLGACTPVSEFVECADQHPEALAVVIGSINGHAVEDLTPLRAAKDRGMLPCPVIVGGNLSVGSSKTGKESDVLRALGVDHVLADIEQLIEVLGELRGAASGRVAFPGENETALLSKPMLSFVA